LINGATNAVSKDGWTSLHYASRLGFVDVVRKILDARADIECRDHFHSYTPLMVGATHGQIEVCSLLLSCGASKQTTNRWGRRALDCARSWGHLELEVLLA
jgi:ankyrin repeat protein